MGLVRALRHTMVTVERRGQGPTELVHRLVRQTMPQLRDALEQADRHLPAFVWRELERFAACGDPKYGFAWLTCGPCAHHRLVPFSCGGRGFCLSCAGRRMASLAAHWVDRVLPEVGLQQWVVTVPWPRRWVLARRLDLLGHVVAVDLEGGRCPVRMGIERHSAVRPGRIGAGDRFAALATQAGRGTERIVLQSPTR